MKNINCILPIKNLALATVETLKKKPIGSILKIAAIVATVALSILFAIYLGPLAALPVVLGLTAINLLVPGLFTFVFYQDIKESLFNQFKKNHSIDKVANSDVVLVLETTNDHNGTFNIDARKDFNKVKKKHAIAFQKVSNVIEVAAAIKQVKSQNNRIKSIWFRAHGNPQELELGKNSPLNIQNVHLLKNFFRHIDPKGTIILESCETAGKNPGSINIAEMIAISAMGRTVIAASKMTNPFSMKINKKNPLNVKMWTELDSSKHYLWKYPSRFFNSIKFFIFLATCGCGPFKKLAFNATQIYRYTPDLLAIRLKNLDFV